MNMQLKKADQKYAGFYDSLKALHKQQSKLKKLLFVYKEMFEQLQKTLVETETFFDAQIAGATAANSGTPGNKGIKTVTKKRSQGGSIGIANHEPANQLLAATKQMHEAQISFNLQYLQLQSQMESENRSYTAVSNIMKTKHDTVKNSISNIR
jgi:hypothetical protein